VTGITALLGLVTATLLSAACSARWRAITNADRDRLIADALDELLRADRPGDEGDGEDVRARSERDLTHITTKAQIEAVSR
jgi:hypothetical protein